MKNPLKTFEPNLAGRDFVVGDLHGSYSAFMHLLKNINFDKTVDRMFSVGDTVDRGPDSLSCLSLLHEDWFHAVMANHEQMMIQKFNGGYGGEYWYRNGGTWGMEAVNDYQAVYVRQDKSRIINETSVQTIDLLPLVEELPFLITVKTKSGKKFHIIHAELPHGPEVTDALLSDPAQVYSLATIQRGDGDAFTWGRYLFGSYFSKNLSNKELLLIDPSLKHATKVFNDELSHIISGHTIVRKPLTIVGQTNIDTGAYSSYYVPPMPYAPTPQKPPEWARLTCVELDTWKFYQATDTLFNEVEPVVISRDDIK